MRTIDLTNARNVELWSGRRLYVTQRSGPSLFSLPRGAATLSEGRQRSTITFGNLAKATCQIEAPMDLARQVFHAIIEAEAPEQGKRVSCK